MSEIEILYENAEPEKDCKLYGNYRMCPYKTRECTDCKYFIYPPFTAEKQIELIKWLAVRFNSDYISSQHNKIKDVWIFRLHDLTVFPCIYEGRNKDFTEALCNLINNLWQDLTDVEKEEIKEILK